MGPGTDRGSSVSRWMEGRGMRLYLHRLWMSYVEMLVRSLLRTMLRVLLNGARTLLGRAWLQHD